MTASSLFHMEHKYDMYKLHTHTYNTFTVLVYVTHSRKRGPFPQKSDCEFRGVARISARGGLIQHALMPLYSSLRNRTPQGTRGVGRNLQRGFPVDSACCKAAPPCIAWKKNSISQRSDFEKRYNKPIMLGTLASYRLFLIVK